MVDDTAVIAMIRSGCVAFPLSPNEAAEISHDARALIFAELANGGLYFSSYDMDRAVTEADILALAHQHDVQTDPVQPGIPCDSNTKERRHG